MNYLNQHYIKYRRKAVLAAMQMVVNPQNVCSSVDHEWADCDFAFLASKSLFTCKKLKYEV